MALHNTQELDRLVRLVLATGRVKGVRPVSALIIAKTGMGKTDVLAGYERYPGIVYGGNLTPYALYRGWGRAILEHKVHHIVIPDFSAFLLKSNDQREPIISFFNTLIEDGLVRYLSFRMNWSPEAFGITLDRPARVGLLAAASEQFLTKHGERFISEVGFLSRLLPVSYSYSSEAVQAIFEGLYKGSHHANSSFPVEVLPPERSIDFPEVFGPIIRGWAEKTRDPQDTLAIRRYKQLEALCMANALLAGRTAVEKGDLQALEGMLDFVTFSAKKRL